MKTMTPNNTNSSTTLTQIKSSPVLLPTQLTKPALVKHPPHVKFSVDTFSPKVSQIFVSLFFFFMGILVMAKIFHGF